MSSTLIVAGNRLTPARLNSPPRGIIAWANRTTDKTFNTTETPVLRLDSVPLLAGRSYAIKLPRLRADYSGGTVTADRVAFRLRFSNSGVATVASTTLGRAESGDQQSVSLEVLRQPGGDETASFLLTALQYNVVAASGSLKGSDEGGIDLMVVDLGLAVTDTGVDL